MTLMKKLRMILKTLLYPLTVVLVLIVFAAMTEGISDAHRAQKLAQIEDACRFAAVSCYAAEGFYPPDFAYLAEHYGVTVDESRYAVFYEAIADNLMPEITVVALDE